MSFDPKLQAIQGADDWDEFVKLTRDKSRLAELFNESRSRLKLIVSSSMDPRLRARVDPSDVLQETFVEATARINDYVSAPQVSLFVWLRFLAKQQLAKMYRRHVGAQARDVRRDVSMDWTGNGRESAVVLAAQVAARLTTASSAMQRKEAKFEIQQALSQLDRKSREILLLRHFEQLGNNEAAEVLEISVTAACNRYIRALERLKCILNASGGRQ